MSLLAATGILNRCAKRRLVVRWCHGACHGLLATGILNRCAKRRLVVRPCHGTCHGLRARGFSMSRREHRRVPCVGQSLPALFARGGRDGRLQLVKRGEHLCCTRLRSAHQGGNSGRLGAASNLGGTLSFYSDKPRDYFVPAVGARHGAGASLSPSEPSARRPHAADQIESLANLAA
jgi:hypothetical protein